MAINLLCILLQTLGLGGNNTAETANISGMEFYVFSVSAANSQEISIYFNKYLFGRNKYFLAYFWEENKYILAWVSFIEKVKEKVL